MESLAQFLFVAFVVLVSIGNAAAVWWHWLRIPTQEERARMDAAARWQAKVLRTRRPT